METADEIMCTRTVDHEAAGVEGIGGPAQQRHRGAVSGTFSVSELRTAMQQHLRTNGALSSLKTQLRSIVVMELMRKQKAGLAAAKRREMSCVASDAGPQLSFAELEHARQGVSLSAASAPAGGGPSVTWSRCVADALVENHLRRTDRPFSLSLFSTEAEVPPLSEGGSPSEEESCLGQLLALSVGDYTTDEDPMPGSLHKKGMQRKSMLQVLVEHQLRRGEHYQHEYTTKYHHQGTQTPSVGPNDGVDDDSGAQVASLECRLAAVDARYALTFSQLKHNNQAFFTRAEVERRLQQYKAEIHEQLRAEYQQKYASFERSALREALEASEDKYKQLVQHKTVELRALEQSLVARCEQERERLHLAREGLERQRLALEARQRDMDKSLHEYEVELTKSDTAQRELQDKIRLLRAQCAKWEDLCGTRLMEAEGARGREGRRIEELRRMQAEHAAELRLRDEELSRLRWRVRWLLNSQNAQTPGSPDTATTASEAPATRKSSGGMNEQLYQLLVRAEELQRNTFMQQQTQQAQQVDFLQHRRERWDATWQDSRSPAVERDREREIHPTVSGSHKPASPYTVIPEDSAAAEPQVVPATDEAQSPTPSQLPPATAPLTPDGTSPVDKRESASSPITLSSQCTSEDGVPANVEKHPDAAAAHPPDHAKSPPPPSRSPSEPPSSLPTNSSASAPPVSKGNHSTPPSPVSTDEQEQAAGERVALTNMATVEQEEAEARDALCNGEEETRKGMAWSERSQRTVLIAQEEARSAERGSSTNSSAASGRPAFMRHMAEVPAREGLADVDPILGDDDSYDDDILFRKSDRSSSQSF